jgi:hypothetical protein
MVIFPVRGVVYLAIVGYIGYVNNGYYKLDKVWINAINLQACTLVFTNTNKSNGREGKKIYLKLKLVGIMKIGGCCKRL